MVRRHITALRLGLMAADGVSAAGLFVIISILRFGPADWRQSWATAGVDAVILAALYSLSWVATLWLFGLYRLRVRWSARTEVIDVGRAVLLLAVATFSVLFWLKLPNVSRQFLLILFPAQLVLTTVSRAALRSVVASARARGLNSRYMLIVGSGAAARAFAARIALRPEMGLHVIGHLASPAGDDEATDGTMAWLSMPPGAARHTTQRPILGSIEDIEHVLHTRVVDEVAICLPSSQLAYVEPITRLCEDEGRIVRIPTEDTGLTLPGARIEEFDGIRVLSLAYGPDRALALLAKRALDVSAAATALIVLSPILLAIAVLIRVRDGGPVLFQQTRIGEHGRPFLVIKFRTMGLDAEDRLPELAELNEIQGHAFKVTDDPRITPTGRVLRRLSLDELPQLWNVVRGEMSLVGPRPPLPREVQGYDLWHRRRLSMKPGITGLWQVAARREADFDRWVRMDLEYIDRWSLWLDLKIIARTIPAMLGQQGR